MNQSPPNDIAAMLNSSTTGQHLLLGSLVIPKDLNDPTDVTEGIEDGLMKFWVTDGVLYLGIYSADIGDWTVLTESTS